MVTERLQDLLNIFNKKNSRGDKQLEGLIITGFASIFLKITVSIILFIKSKIFKSF